MIKQTIEYTKWDYMGQAKRQLQNLYFEHLKIYTKKTNILKFKFSHTWKIYRIYRNSQTSAT